MGRPKTIAKTKTITNFQDRTGPMFVPALILSQPSFNVKYAHCLGHTFISQKYTK